MAGSMHSTNEGDEVYDILGVRFSVRCTSPIDHSLSSYFATMERDIEGQQVMQQRLPSKLVQHLTALYAEPTERSNVGSMLRGVRYKHYNNAQVAVIGTAADELQETLIPVLDNWPSEVISIITEFVGHSLVLLRGPGLNILRSTAASCDDESFFDDYGNEKIVDWVDTLCPPSIVDVDLDWCFAIFLMLGVMPSVAAYEENCCRLLNHKLMSVICGNTPLSFCRHSAK